VDISNRPDPEILFFGPDENTADLMDWAAEHARARGATWWKSFTTGKSAALLGGIPHDACELVVYRQDDIALALRFRLSSGCRVYANDTLDGMTSLSVRQYIIGVLKAHGLNEKDVTKVRACFHIREWSGVEVD
jgi:glutamate dehydrogenase